MKKTALILGLITTASLAFGQGQINFVNRNINGNANDVDAKIYGIETGNPSLAKTGNTAAGVPAGSQTYTGALLNGPNYHAALYYEVNGTPGTFALAPGSETTFRTGGGAGLFTGVIVSIPGWGESSRPNLKVVAWDTTSPGGSSWATARDRGESAVFQAQPLGLITVQPPGLTGLTSFNITSVPEPSVLAFGALGLVGFLIRRRK